MSSLSQNKAPVLEEESNLSQQTGYFVGKFGILAMVAVLVIAAWFGQIAISLLAGLILSAAGLARLWNRLSLVRVSYHRSVSEHRAFPGEDIELKLNVVNRKLLPLPWVRIVDKIPRELLQVHGGPTDKSGSVASSLTRVTSLLWYTGATWRSKLHCKRRGYFSLGPTTIWSGDIFGFYRRSITQSNMDTIIVYPKIYPLPKLGLPAPFPFGGAKAERRIFQDPTLTIGVRDYSPHDSLRHIHWKASARHQGLQVKVFEPTTTLKVIVFLAVDSFRYDGVKREDDFELGISTAASVANNLILYRNPVGLYINGFLADANRPVRIMPGNGNGQLITILEALAKVTMKPGDSLSTFLQDNRYGLPWGTTLTLIIGKASEHLGDLLMSLRESGYKVVVLQIGMPQGDDEHYGVSWYNITIPGGFMEFAAGGTR